MASIQFDGRLVTTPATVFFARAEYERIRQVSIRVGPDIARRATRQVQRSWDASPSARDRAAPVGDSHEP